MNFAAALYNRRREWQAAQAQAEEVITFATERGLPLYAALGAFYRGGALVGQEQYQEGIAQIRQGTAAFQATGMELGLSAVLYVLANAYRQTGQIAEGLEALDEAFTAAHKSGQPTYEAELYRVKGELTLQSKQVQDKSRASHGQVEDNSENTNPQSPIPNPQAEAEACFLKAIEIAQRQHAKSLELRAVMSLARLWQSQGKKGEAWQILVDIYGWFTEGFDTADLQEAKMLLEELLG
jgi:predicted ATPase